MKSFFLVALIFTGSFIFSQEAPQRTEEDVEEKIIEMSILDSRSRLRRHDSEDEKLVVSKVGNSIQSFVKVSKNELVQKNFDDKLRLIQENAWRSKEQDQKPDQIFKTVNYEYEINSLQPRKIDEKNFLESTQTISLFNTFGLITEKTVYKLRKDDTTKKTETIKTEASKIEEVRVEPILSEYSESEIIQKQIWKYNNKQQIIEERTTKEGFISVIRYDYSELWDKPNVQYFENWVTTRKIVYRSANEYIDTVYFDDTMSIQTEYISDVKKSEVYYLNGVEIRRRTY